MRRAPIGLVKYKCLISRTKTTQTRARTLFELKGESQFLREETKKKRNAFLMAFTTIREAQESEIKEPASSTAYMKSCQTDQPWQTRAILWSNWNFLDQKTRPRPDGIMIGMLRHARCRCLLLFNQTGGKKAKIRNQKMKEENWGKGKHITPVLTKETKR